MSEISILLCSQILSEYHGSVIEKVGLAMTKHGPLPMKNISKLTGLRLEQVKKALFTLIQHHMVTFEVHKRHFVQYSINLQHVLLRPRFSRYVYIAKALHEDTGEFLTEELLQHGRLTTGVLVDKVTQRLNETSSTDSTTSSRESVYNVFKLLVHGGYIHRCPTRANDSSEEVPNLTVDEDNMFSVPPLPAWKKENTEKSENEQPRKRLKGHSSEVTEDTVYWSVAYDRFHRDMLDECITSAIVQKIDQKAAQIVRAILRISEGRSASDCEATMPLTSHEIYEALPKDIGLDKTIMDQYLKLMVDDLSIDFLLKVGDSGGGLYQINFVKALTALATAHVESVVQERFGSKCLRIFRLLLKKKQTEQAQIEEHVMIPAKETKDLLYQMFAENFIGLTELAKSDPGKAIYLFSVVLPQLVRMILQSSYKAMINLMTRRQHETKENKRLLEKQQRLDAIAASIDPNDETQKEELESMITPAEKIQLTKIKHCTNKFEQSELQLDDTMFVFQQYIQYSKQSVPAAKKPINLLDS